MALIRLQMILKPISQRNPSDKVQSLLFSAPGMKENLKITVPLCHEDNDLKNQFITAK